MKKFLYILLVFLFVSCGKDVRHKRIGSTISLTTSTVGTYDANTLDLIVKLAEQRNDSAIMNIRHAKIGKVQIETFSDKGIWVLSEHVK